MIALSAGFSYCLQCIDNGSNKELSVLHLFSIFNALYPRTRKPAAKTFLIATEDIKWLKLHLDYILAKKA